MLHVSSSILLHFLARGSIYSTCKALCRFTALQEFGKVSSNSSMYFSFTINLFSQSKKMTHLAGMKISFSRLPLLYSV